MSSAATEPLEPAAPTLPRPIPRGWAARLIADGAVAAVVGLWWLAANHYGPFVLPDPLSVARDLLALFTNPLLLAHVAASVVGNIVMCRTAAGRSTVRTQRSSATYRRMFCTKSVPE